MVLWQSWHGFRRVLTRSFPSLLRPRYSTKPAGLPPWSPAASVLQDLESKCNNPVFSTVKQLAHTKGGGVFGQLEPIQVTERDHPDAQEWNWMAVAEAMDFKDTVSRLERVGVRCRDLPLHGVTPPARPEPGTLPHPELCSATPQPPTWLVMHILVNQVQTYYDMMTALRLVYHHFPFA